MHTGGWDADGAQTKEDAGESRPITVKSGPFATVLSPAETDEHHRDDGHLSTATLSFS